MTGKRRYVILAPGVFSSRLSKTAHGVIAYATDRTVAVIDPSRAGQSVKDAIPYLDSDAPIVAGLRESLVYEPTSLLVGVAPMGGALPADWRSEIVAALEAGLEVVSGLHDALAEDAEFLAAAERGKTSIWDVRIPPRTPLFSGAAWSVRPFVLLTVGSDCTVGKMTVSLELTRAARDRGRKPEFIATGQTGIMIAGRGIAIDRVIADFAPGAAEALVTGHAPESDLLLVEGQGGINHAAYAPVTLALLYGAAPDALLLVHHVARTTIEGLETPILSYSESINAYETLTATVKPSKVVGIALNTSSLSEAEARNAIEDARSESGLPADDVVRYGPHALYDAIAPKLREKAPLRRSRAPQIRQKSLTL
jgi:uncharacterized NAD-dependent epimerase/dehydratase family protein